MSEVLRLVRKDELTQRVEKATVELVGAWLDRRSEHTARAYRGDLERLALWLGVSGIEEAVQRLLGMGQGELNALVYQYQQRLRRSGRSPATTNRAMAAIKSLLKMGRRFGVTRLELQVDRERHRQYRDTQGPPLSTIRRMVEDLENRAKSQAKAVRDLAIVRLLFNAALRCHEIVGADLEHYEPHRKRLSILGKARSEREWIDLSPKASKALRAWVKVRGQRPGALFVSFTYYGTGPLARTKINPRLNRLQRQDIFRMCRGYGARPHGLRHAAITQALELTNGNVAKVMRFSRHLNPAVVMTYNDNRKHTALKVSTMLDGLA